MSKGKIQKNAKQSVKKPVNKSVNYGDLSLEAHLKHGGKLELKSKFPLKNEQDLSVAYTPGVGAVCLDIQKNHSSKRLTLKKNTVAIISDGSAVLGFGNIGAEAAIPVMEGKAVLLKHFAGVDAFPICLKTQDTDEIINIIKNLEPVFGGVNLEDIAAPKCFEIEDRLKKEVSIPVMHDDQWGAATASLAGFINALKVTKKKKDKVNVCVVGAGAAGVATVLLLSAYGIKNIVTFDTKGAIFAERGDIKTADANNKKRQISAFNINNLTGSLEENMHNFDVFIGLSAPGILTVEMIKRMKKDPIIFAMANPVPEIMPDHAKSAGAKVVATGRSDFPNQLNNSIFFPGFWKGMLEISNKNKSIQYDISLFVKIAEVIAKSVKNVNENNIIPSTVNSDVHEVVYKAVLKYCK